MLFSLILPSERNEGIICRTRKGFSLFLLKNRRAIPAKSSSCCISHYKRNPKKMSSFLAFHPRPLLLSPLPYRCKPPSPLLFPNLLYMNRGELLVARLGSTEHLPDFETAAQELLGRAEGLLYTVADAVVSASSSDAATAAVEGSKQNSDWFSGIANYMETVLKILKGGLSALHIPYAYGFAIILLTVLVKAATFPLTKKQVESALAMRSLQPQVKAIQQRYAGDKERIQLETARLYKLAGVNPLAGCLPTLATIPVWIGLYRALSNVADEGLLTEGFFWIPSLSGPTTIAARQSGSGTSWLFPFIDGHPPLGWHDTLAYLVLPVLLVISQYVSAQIMQPPQNDDPNQQSAQAVTKLLPLMIGYFALSVPSGLSLYWLTNNILSTAQQIWLQKLGGAKNPVKQFSDSIVQDEASDIRKSNIQKSVLEVETEKINSSQVKADLGGPRPGERFKQIKEEEARRRKQKEEEKRRVEEEKRKPVESSMDSSIITEKKNSEIKFSDNINGENSENMMTSQFSAPKNGVSFKANPAVNGEEGTLRNAQKEQASEMHVSNGKQTPDHDTLDRRERKNKRDDE